MLHSANQIRLVSEDSWLEPYSDYISDRLYRYKGMMAHLAESQSSLLEFANLHRFLGFNYDSATKGWWYREWAPSASALYITGTFNGWSRTSHPMMMNASRVWEIFLPDSPTDGSTAFGHGQEYKVCVQSIMGQHDRIPAFANYVVQDDVSKDFTPRLWAPDEPYTWKHTGTFPRKNPIIYEAHVGMGQEEAAVGTYRDFADKILPRIKAAGYDTIQLMAVQEHPFYGSYGYHVSNLFAPSSRFGTPDDLRYLVDMVHGAGIAIIMDIVHSHAVRNFNEGLDKFDGGPATYFHLGEKGDHAAWDSKLYNYGKLEVSQFLLSNIRYWLEEFQFDGFRFDGVTSMLYHHHGLGKDFLGYADYFNEDADKDAILYLQLANQVLHETKPSAFSVAEDMSGLPGLCRAIPDGGVGFDFRLGMGLPDFWIKTIKEVTDEAIDIEGLYWHLLNRRKHEPTIAYVESHDQALVGDQTIAFRLMGTDMYTAMNIGSKSIVIDRGVALHKLIKFITLALGGEGWLNFIGNEFGHPEWIDFPREGNNWSYAFARRQWSLADSPFLRYGQLGAWDAAMVGLAKQTGLLGATESTLLNVDVRNKTLAFEKAGLIFVFNFHPMAAIPDYKIPVPKHGKYVSVLSSDDTAFGGFGRTAAGSEHFSDEAQYISFYNVNRTAQVFALAE